MSRIAIADIKHSETENDLVDLSNDEQRLINGGVVVVIIIIIER